MTTADKQHLTIAAQDLRIGDDISNGFTWLPVRDVVHSAIAPGFIIVYFGVLGLFPCMLPATMQVPVRRAAE